MHLLLLLEYPRIHQIGQSGHVTVADKRIGVTCQAGLQEMIVVVGQRLSLLRIVVVAVESPREVGLIAIGHRDTRAPRGGTVGTQLDVVPLVGVLLTSAHGVVYGQIGDVTLLDNHAVVDVLDMTLGIAVDVEFLSERTADEELGA